MANWLERAKREIPKGADQTTAIADERNLTAVTAVRQAGKPNISQASIGSNGSALVAVFKERQIVNKSMAQMSSEDESAIRAWLDHIGEVDQSIIADVLERGSRDMETLKYCLAQAGMIAPAATMDAWNRCGDCSHFKRIVHPNLGHCSRGKPEAIVGLWDSDWRCCDDFKSNSGSF